MIDLLYRHWNAYKGGKRTHIFAIDSSFHSHCYRQSTEISSKPPRDLTPGDYDAPPFSLGGQDDYAFSPDGQEICYTSNHDKVEATSTNNDLWIVSVNGGAAKNITAENPASDSTPLYSPDGKYIAYRAQQRPGYESDRFRLMLYDRKMGEKKNLAGKLDDLGWNLHLVPRLLSVLLQLRDKGFAHILASVDLASTVPGMSPPRDMRMAPDTMMTWHSRETVRPCFYADDHADPNGDLEIEWPFLKVLAISCTHINDAVLSQICMSPLESFLVHRCTRR